LGGLIRNLSANQYSQELNIYGPKGIKEIYKNLVTNIPGEINIKVNINEINEGLVFESKHIKVNALKLKHSINCFGYSIQEKDRLKINTEYLEKFGLKQHPILGELQKGKDISWKGKKITIEKATKKIKGKKITLILDTIYCNNCIKLAKDSDILIAESTFSSKDKEVAKKHNHLTSEDAALIAKKSKSKKLILTHFSQRYKNTQELEKEAKKIFKNILCAKDFMKITL
jgi:ribonuclease Z